MIVIALNIYRSSAIFVPPSFSLLLLKGIPACFFQDKVKLRSLCPWGRTSEHVSCWFLTLSSWHMYWSQGLKLGRWSWRESVGTIFAHWHSSHRGRFGDVFPSNELGSFFGSNSSWHKYLMAERLKGPGLSPFPLVGSITYKPHLTHFPLHQKALSTRQKRHEKSVFPDRTWSASFWRL